MKLVLDNNVVGVRVEFAELKHATAEYDDDRDMLMVDRNKAEQEATFRKISFDERLAEIVAGLIALPHVMEVEMKWRERQVRDGTGN